MSLTFTKLFSSITESTIWLEPAPTRLVWITMLAMSDRNGFVFGSVPGLAHRARVSLEECRAALATLLGPDNESRTKDHDGRRLAVIDGGWALLNYEKYRKIQNEEAIRESKREHMRRVRSAPENVESCGSDIPKWKSPSASSSESGSVLDGSDPDRVRAGTRLVPEEWAPKESHSARCQELGLPLDEVVTSFREYEFNREYSDWDRRFSKWITEERTRREANAWKAKPLRREFDPKWKPKTSQRDYGVSLGLTEPELRALLEDCRLKTFVYPFTSEDNQFKREIIALHKRKANPHGLDEKPGRFRKPNDPRPPTVFGAITARRPG